MKTDFFFGSVFWGSVLIFVGLSIILKMIFNINIPFFRLIFALVLIYFGIHILIGGSIFKKCGNTVMFGEPKTAMSSPDNVYKIVCGKGVIDLTSVDISSKTANAEIDIVFGSGSLKLNPEIPARITINSAFSASKMPDGNEIVLGRYNYRTKTFKEDEKHLEVTANIVFGGFEITDK